MKKQQKRIMKRKIIFGIILFSAFFLLILSSNSISNNTSDKGQNSETKIKSEIISSKPSESGYIPSITVDCLRLEPAYEQIIDTSNYDVLYANNDTYHFLFINASTSLTGKSISIYTDDFTYNLTLEKIQTSFLSSYHVNATLELQIIQALVTNDFKISINSDILTLQVVPNIHLIEENIPPIIEEEKGKNTITRLGIIEGWLYDFNKMSTMQQILWVAFIVSAIWLFAIFIVREHNLLFKNPIVVTGNTVPKKIWNRYIPKKQRDIDDTGKETDYGKDIIKLGRFLTERPSEMLDGYFEFYFKHGKKFILKIYCKVRYDDIKGTRKREVNIIQREHWDYETTLLELPPELQPNVRILKNTFKNRFLRYLARRFPSKRLPMKIDDILDYETIDKKVKQVIIWQYIYDKEYLGFTADVKYERKIPTEKDPDATEKIPLEHDVPWHEIELLIRDPMVILDEKKDISNKKVKIIPVDEKFKDHFKNSASMERSKRAYLDSIYLKELKRLNDEIELLTMENLNLEKEFKLKYIEAIKKYFRERIPSYSEFLDDIMPEYKLRGTLGNTKEEALFLAERRDKIRKLDNKIADLDDPKYVKEMETKLKQAEAIIETYKKGNGHPKKKKSLLEELGAIEDNIEEEEEE